MTWIAKASISIAGRKSAARFESLTQRVKESQERKLRAILQRNAGTEYGKQFTFGSIGSLTDYGHAVPVIKYEHISERIDRMANGEPNVLTAEKPLMFARTSGTTGKPKLIPVTPTCRGSDHADQMRTWLFYAQKDHPRLFQGKVLTLVSPAVEGQTSAGIPYGSTSGDMYRNMPAIVRKTYVVPYPVFEIEDHEAEFYVILRLGLAANVTFLCTANPSSIAKLCEFADAHADELIRDVSDGGLRSDLVLSAQQRVFVQALCKPERERARRLEEMRARRDGRLLPGDLWPELQLIGCWKGGTVGAHVDGFPAWFDPDGTAPVAVRDWGYLSSEARGSIPISDDGSGGVLAVGTNVYEFVDLDQVDAEPENPESWTFLGAHEVDSPRDYYVFLTTTGGLYRYDINDVVRVEGFHNDAPIITFQRKGRGMTSLTGEKVSDQHVIEAVTSAASELSVALQHFRALADADGARYVFQIEPQGELSESQGHELLEAIERRLVGLNLEYESKRKSQRLEAPELHVMRAGWYERGKRDQGGRLFQSKTVVLEPKQEPEYSIRSQEMTVSRIELQPRTKR